MYNSPVKIASAPPEARIVVVVVPIEAVEEIELIISPIIGELARHVPSERWGIASGQLVQVVEEPRQFSQGAEQPF